MNSANILMKRRRERERERDDREMIRNKNTNLGQRESKHIGSTDSRDKDNWQQLSLTAISTHAP